MNLGRARSWFLCTDKLQKKSLKSQQATEREGIPFQEHKPIQRHREFWHWILVQTKSLKKKKKKNDNKIGGRSANRTLRLHFHKSLSHSQLFLNLITRPSIRTPVKLKVIRIKSGGGNKQTNKNKTKTNEETLTHKAPGLAKSNAKKIKKKYLNYTTKDDKNITSVHQNHNTHTRSSAFFFFFFAVWKKKKTWTFKSSILSKPLLKMYSTKWAVSRLPLEHQAWLKRHKKNKNSTNTKKNDKTNKHETARHTHSFPEWKLNQQKKKIKKNKIKQKQKKNTKTKKEHKSKKLNKHNKHTKQTNTTQHDTPTHSRNENSTNKTN